MQHRELPVRLGEIKEKAFDDDFIKKFKERQISDAYSICYEVVMYSDRVVIHAVLQKRIIKEFHVGHPGMLMMKSLTKSYVN